MADLLEKGSNWLEGQRHHHLTRPVVYQRGEQSVELAATVGRTVFEQSDAYGLIHRIESRDFLVQTADLVLSGLPVLPEAGDRIREPDGEQTRVYEVLAPGTAPPFRYSDPYRRTLRIHTKHVRTDTAGLLQVTEVVSGTLALEWRFNGAIDENVAAIDPAFEVFYEPFGAVQGWIVPNSVLVVGADFVRFGYSGQPPAGAPWRIVTQPQVVRPVAGDHAVPQNGLVT